MARRVRIALRSLLAAVLSTVPAVAGHRLLDATGPLIAVTVWAGLFAVLLVLWEEVSWRRGVLRWISLAAAALGALVLIADMVIIPLSAYLLWFELVAAGNARGAVSFVYVMLVAYGSALFAAGVTRRPVLVGAAYLAWMSFLSIPILARPEPVVLLVASSLITIVAGAGSGRGRTSGARARSAWHAFVLLMLSIGAGAGLAQVTDAQGSRFVDNVLSPRFRDTVVAILPNFPIMYDIPGYGYRFASENIGRSPVLSNRALFRVSPVESTSLYLRTEVFHVFTGSGWRVSNRIESDTDVEQANGDDRVDEQRLRTTEITILADFYSLVPHTLDTRGMSISDRDELRFQRSGQAVGFQLSDPLLFGDRVSLYREPASPFLREGPVLHGQLQDGDVYLELPGDIPETIRELAEGLRGDTDSQTIVNTLRFLRDGFEYTLEPPQPSESSRFLSAFLQEHRRGFCVHYATAFTVLSRLQGIPARYVTGFLVQPPSPDEFGMGMEMGMFEVVTVSGYSAHAWAEVYVPEVGWRIVEATPPMQPVGYEDTFFDRFASIRNEGRTYLQLEEILGQDLRDRVSTIRFHVRFPDIPAWSWGVPVVLLIGFGTTVLHRRRKIESRFQRVVRRVRDRSVRSGFPVPERVGWTGWAAHGDRHASRVATVAVRVYFGGRSPTRRDVRYLQRWSARRLSRRGIRVGS